jgi:steroid delta-isomerase-like uncharacterized protein
LETLRFYCPFDATIIPLSVFDYPGCAPPPVSEQPIRRFEMSSDAAHAFIRRFTSFINSGDSNLAPELVSMDAIFHAPGAPAPLLGPDGYLDLLATLRSAFSDVRWVLEEAVVEGDKIAARFSMSGTNDGSFMGAPPTGKAFQATSMGFYKLSGGKIVEERGLPDMLSILQQIGLVPQPS